MQVRPRTEVREEGAHEGPDVVLQRRDPARGEALADEAAQLGLHRWVEHHDRGSEPELADLVRVEGESLGGGEVLRPSDRVPHVGEPGQCPVGRCLMGLGVVVDGVVLPQRGVRRVRVVLEGRVERVVDRAHRVILRLDPRPPPQWVDVAAVGHGVVAEEVVAAVQVGDPEADVDPARVGQAPARHRDGDLLARRTGWTSGSPGSVSSLPLRSVEVGRAFPRARPRGRG